MRAPVAPAPARGSALREVEVVTGAAIAIVDGRIAACGPRDQVLRDHGDLPVHDAGGRAAIPGLVDCHTHAAFGGDRAGEFDLRSQGAGYEQIHAAGGGIAASVRDTRAAAADGTLGRLLDRHLAWMAAAGTTTAEVKSGYGLDRDTELAMLDAAGAGHPIEVAPTFLGAHAVGPEWDDADAYLTFVIEQVLPQAAGRAEAADVFLERGAFDRDQAERYLRAAAGHGLALRLHADQFSQAGGVGARRRAGRPLGRPPRGDRPRGRRCAGGQRRGGRAAARLRDHARPAAPARPRSRRRRGDRGAGHRLQPGQRLLPLPAARDVAGLHAAGHVPGRGAGGVHRERGLGAGTRRPPRPDRQRDTMATWCCSTPTTGGTPPTTWAARPWPA